MRRLALLAIAALPITATAAERFKPSDRHRMVLPSVPEISPDGRSVALLVSRANLKDDRWDPELVVVDVASGATRTMTFERRGVASPRWSPDGEQLAFLANPPAAVSSTG